jgi:hypothetical protein
VLTHSSVVANRLGAGWTPCAIELVFGVRILLSATLVASCARDVPALERDLPRDARSAIAIADATVGDAVSRPVVATTRLSVLDSDILCLHDASSARCLVLTGGADPTGKSVAQTPLPDLAIKLTDGSTSCMWRDDRLACDGAAPIDNVQLVVGESQRYLQSTLQVWFITPRTDASGRQTLASLHAMKSLPSYVRQLALGFMAGCALTGDGTVSCWSDPSQPRKVVTPDHVAEIAIVDPFTLCVRTEDGSVYCTPRFVPPEPFACNTNAFLCGSGGIEGPTPTHPFDPVVPLTRPLQRLRLPEPARALVGDNGQLFVAAIDNVMPGPAMGFGGCVLGASGAVACFATCEHGWGVFRVTGVPAISELSPDSVNGHALAVDGTVWSWPHACSGDVVATQVELAPVVQLARPLEIRVGPAGEQFPTRCVLTRSGDVTCWTRDRSGQLSLRFDPRVLARSPFGDHRY